MTLALACAAVFCAGGLLVMRGLRPAPAPLALRLAQIQSAPAAPAGRQESGRPGSLGRLLVDGLDPVGERFGGMRADLAITETDLGAHLAQRVGTAGLGAGIGLGMGLALSVGGVPVPGLAVVILALGLGAGGGVLPAWLLRAAAAERRAEMTHVLAGYVDLTGVVLAAGEGLETALRHAAAMGSGWAYDSLSRALESARLTRRPAWGALSEMGQALGLTELVELAEGLGLAGTEGSRLRESLAARAASLREHELSEAEAKAGSATEGMSAPLVAILAGFVALIGYPALVGVMGGLH